MTDQSDIGLGDKLDSIFKLINDWLKYAEQKLTGLIVLNSALVWGYSRLINNYDSLSQTSTYLNGMAYFLSVLSILICLVSIMPILNKKLLKQGDMLATDNVFYFSDIKKYNAVQYLNLLNKKLGGNQRVFSEYHRDMAKQVIYNSGIASNKFSMMKLASWMTLIAIITFIVAYCSVIQG